MNLHEYQGRVLFRAAGIPMPDGDVASTPSEAESIARRVGGTVVVKAQVHAGGRGKAGGVKLAKNAAEAAAAAEKILGMSIKGLVVQKVLVVPAADIAAEAYVGLIMDRASQRPVFMVSPAGGIDIEEVAEKTPEKIMRLAVDPRYGLLPHQALSLALFLYPDIAQARAAADRLLRGQVEAIALLLTVIFLVMSVMFTSFKGGLIALVPSVMPVERRNGKVGWPGSMSV